MAKNKEGQPLKSKVEALDDPRDDTPDLLLSLGSNGFSTLVFASRLRLVARLSPLIHDHINMLGRYSFAMPETVARGELRPLRNPTVDQE